jgi:hypothetical protein
LEEFEALSFDETEHIIWKKYLEKFLDTHEEVVLPERVSFEISILNVEGKCKVALVFAQVFQQTLSPESKAKGYEHHIVTGDHPLIRNRPYSVSPAEKDFIKTEVQKLVEARMVQPCPVLGLRLLSSFPTRMAKCGFFWIIGS